MPERSIDIGTYKSISEIVEATQWWNLPENAVGLLPRYLRHGVRDAAMYLKALQHHPEVIPVGVNLTDMSIGAAFHDIAKPWVDAEVWDKGKLSPIDKYLIHRHPSVSYLILSRLRDERGIIVPEVALVIALDHHERLDGSGYPNGLTGDQIPGFVQLFSVVDYVVSMAEGPKVRAYRECGMTPAEIEAFFTNDMKDKLNQTYVKSVLDLIRNGEHMEVPELEDLVSLRTT